MPVSQLLEGPSMETAEQLECLVLRCQVGDRDAFEEVFRRFQPRIEYYVRRLSRSDRGVEDLLQDIWLKVIRKIHSLKHPRAFVSWLYRVARHELYGRGRRPVHMAELPEETAAPGGDPDAVLIAAEDAARVHRSLDCLRPLHREILILSFMEQLAHAEIAEILVCTPGTVRTRLYYAKQALRKELERTDG
jgi:RNA polymerase sigma-70 factor (ECF subfamily)